MANAWQADSRPNLSGAGPVAQARRYGSRSSPSVKPLFIAAVPPLQNGLATAKVSAISGAAAPPTVLRVVVKGAIDTRPTSDTKTSVVLDRSSRRNACFSLTHSCGMQKPETALQLWPSGQSLSMMQATLAFGDVHIGLRMIDPYDARRTPRT